MRCNPDIVFILAIALGSYSLLFAQTGNNGTIQSLLSKLTVEQKIRLIVGNGFPDNETAKKARDKVSGSAGSTYPMEHLHLPAAVLSDGPAGLRISPTRNGSIQRYYATGFPIATLQPSMAKDKSTVSYISPEREWTEGREQLIIPYSNAFKNKTASSEMYYKHLYTNLGYEKTLPQGLMLQVWNDITKTNYKKRGDIEPEVLCVLPGMGVMNWIGYENGPEDLSELKTSLEAMSKWIEAIK